MPWYLYLIGALGLALLMIVHEGGHFLAARAYGMRVTKFSIGFGPTIFKVVPDEGYFWFTTAAGRIRIRLWRHDPEKHGPTVFQVAAIPFLAYVQIAGMNPLEEVDPNDKGSYANASLVGRIVAIFAGPLANYLFASVLFLGVYSVAGKLVTVDRDSTTISVLDGRPASNAGIKDGDTIVNVGGVEVENWTKMAENISKHPGEKIPITVKRNNERVTIEVTPSDEGGKGRIGVGLYRYRQKVSLQEAGELAVKRPALVLKDLVLGLGEWLRRRTVEDLGGPKKMVEATAEAAKSGWADFVEFMAALSAYLGAFNLIPFPALDGGRLIFLGYEAATRRRANPRIEAVIHGVGLIMLLGLMGYVTLFNDFRLGAK
ncbi:MAG: M50 family metallopeptidase [Polyangiaceae bacterium]